jgi:hypothetical protein
LLREVRDGMAPVTRRLSAEGFDDVQDGELLVLMAPGENNEAIGNRLRKAGITDVPIGSVTEMLMSREYLTRRVNPAEPEQASIAVTKRGAKARKLVIEALMLQRCVDFPFRQGDIIISAAPKSGTTWVQMICALLIFQTPDLAVSIQELSPWLDNRKITRAALFAQLAAQEHRRFVKTHVPLDKMTIDSRATYIGVARHPLDSALSFHHQIEMIRGETKKPTPPIREQLLKFINAEESRRDEPISRQMKILIGAWARRGEPNVALVRYEDLCADLEGQMRSLAARLDITVPETTWPSLVKAASFDQMRASADRIQPLDELENPADFFWKGKTGAGRALLTNAESARYYERVAQLAPTELIQWVHREPEFSG